MKNFAGNISSPSGNLRPSQIRNSRGVVAELNIVAVASVLLLATGLIMMTSASIETASSNYNEPFYFLARQVVFMAVGIIVAIFAILTAK